MLQINYWYEYKILDKDSYNIKDAFFDLENKKRINKKCDDVNPIVIPTSGLKKVRSNFLTLLLAKGFNLTESALKQ